MTARVDVPKEIVVIGLLLSVLLTLPFGLIERMNLSYWILY